MRFLSRLERILVVGLLIGLGNAALAQNVPRDDSPIQLDGIFKTDQLPEIGAKQLAADYLQLPEPKGSAKRHALGIGPSARGSKQRATLFGMEVDRAHFSFFQGRMDTVYVRIVDRERGVRMPRPEFERLLSECIEAISQKVGVAPEMEKLRDVPGSTVSPWCRWPKTAYALNYSYRVEDPVRRVPFQAEYISMRLQNPKAGQ